MKVKALIDCVGLGYNLQVGDVVELPNSLAQKLVKFHYVEEVKAVRKPKETKVKE